MSEAGTDLSTKPNSGYRVLARKYRPADFRSLIGQEPMVRTLTNAFATGRIAQAWMLTGVRGVGKTTTARILARALNYKTATVDQPSIELDEIGEHCRAIMEGRHVDVIEMDAASHTGIDDIREIIEQVRYAPVSARYKVYIIDEVHMLSTQAFNGLLKTLEEPPPHVKFIFATTEIRKVPITVLSRCQRFDLQAHRRRPADRPSRQDRRARSDRGRRRALAMIARAAEGSARDCLSILDQAIAHGDGKVVGRCRAPDARPWRPRPHRRPVRASDERRCCGRAARVPHPVRRGRRPGHDPHRPRRIHPSGDAAAFRAVRRRGCLAVRGGAQPRPAFSQSLSLRVLSRTWQMLLKGIPEVQAANRPVSAGEMVLIRIAHAANLPTLDEALKSLDDGSAKPARRAAGAGSAAGRRRQRRFGGRRDPRDRAQWRRPDDAPRRGRTRASAGAAAGRAAAGRRAVPVTSLADIATLADANRDMAFKVLVKRCVRLVRIEPGRLDVNLIGDAPKTLLGDLTVKLKAWTGRNWMVSLSREEGGADARRARGEQTRDRDPRCQERPGGGLDPCPFPRRACHRRAHSERAGGRRPR